MTRNLRALLAADAERWIRAWSRPDVSREDAAVMVTYWHLYEPADPELVDLVLARFSPAEPPNVPGLDWLPSADEVASYTDAVAESLAVPAPVKELPAKPREWRDRCGDVWQERPDGLIALVIEDGLSSLFVYGDVADLEHEFGPLVEVAQ